MISHSQRAALLAISLCPFLLTNEAQAASAPFSVSSRAAELIDFYCIDCHEDGSAKGEIRLDNLSELSLESRLDLLNKLQEQVHFGEMPPAKKSQPSEQERNDLLQWVADELGRHHASKLEDKLRKPEFGNSVDHAKLFSGDYAHLKPFTPDREQL